MKHIKIKFVDYWPNHHLEDDIIYKWLKENYDIEFSDTPEYLIYSCFGYEHMKYDCIRIFYTAENIAPNFNECDYAISFEKMDFGDRNLQLPNFFKYKKEIELINSYDYSKTDEELIKRKFCSYVVSNGKGHEIREKILDELSSYKQIDSGGRFRNNVGGPVKDKIAFQKGYKFSIAFENSSHIGYTTEKILQSFASRTIPIYWGDSRVADYFNPNAFINIMDFDNIEQAIAYIKLIDEDDNKYLSMIKTYPWKNKFVYKNKMQEYDSFMRNIFEQNYEDAFRRSMGVINQHYLMDIATWHDFYVQNKDRNVYMILKKEMRDFWNKIKGK